MKQQQGQQRVISDHNVLIMLLYLLVMISIYSTTIFAFVKIQPLIRTQYHHPNAMQEQKYVRISNNNNNNRISQKRRWNTQIQNSMKNSPILPNKEDDKINANYDKQSKRKVNNNQRMNTENLQYNINYGDNNIINNYNNFSPSRFTVAADMLLQQEKQISTTRQRHDGSNNNNNNMAYTPITSDHIPSSRRMMFASALMGIGTAIALSGDNNDAYAFDKQQQPQQVNNNINNNEGKFIWQVTPINKRTGVTVFDAEQSGYTVAFVTYLSRFLLCFDRDCQIWWYNRASDIPVLASAEQVNAARFAQFGAFSASVEVGLQEYTGQDGPKRFLDALLKRYCPTIQEVQASRIANGQPLLTDTEQKLKEKEIKAARRQIVLLFGLMEKNQPVAELKREIAKIDNAAISRVEIINRGSGYAPGYGSPEVRFPKPDAGDEDNYERATGRAVLSANGKLLRIDVIDRGNGYSKPPEVSISPSATIRFRDRESLKEFSESEDNSAKAQAFLFRSGPNKGRIERIQLTNPGVGYTEKEIIRVKISPPELSRQEGGMTATATAILEYEVSDITIVKNGTGYAADAPINIFVEPPPLTARVNMNDPLIVARLGNDVVNEWLPAMDPKAQTSTVKIQQKTKQLSSAAGKGGQSGCIGRQCYDAPVQAIGYPRPESNRGIFDQISGVDFSRLTLPKQQQFVSASGVDGDEKVILDFGAKTSSSAQLLSLLPAGIGLQFNPDLQRYELAIDPNYQDDKPRWLKQPTRIDPDFGPRGRAPIERDMDLGLEAYLRFILSGAICCSGVHLAVTPIDVVKTKVQADPVNYPGIVKSFRRVLQEEGIEGLAQGWLPTFIGFFVWGGLSYALTEYLRRVWTLALVSGTSSAAALASSNLEVPIILAAAGTAAAIGSFVLCPFESIRIRLVSQRDYAQNAFAVVTRMIKEEGIATFFKAVPLFFAKEIPFAMAKFSVFDITTRSLYDSFPTLKEDIQLSFLVSLFGGILGGIVAAVVSNPADITITTMKKTKTAVGIVGAFDMVWEQGGPPAFFRGLPLRMVFYSLVVGLQFLVYDSVRLALGVGSDDLKLYLDVLGGALSESDGPL